MSLAKSKLRYAVNGDQPGKGKGNVKRHERKRTREQHRRYILTNQIAAKTKENIKGPHTQ